MQWSGITEGIADTVLRHRFEPADGHALDGIIASPVAEDLAFADVSVWDGHSGRRQPGRCVVIRDGLISEVVEASRPLPTGIKVISASGKTLIPGLIDAHVHLMFDSGPDLLTRAPHLMREWLDLRRNREKNRVEKLLEDAQIKLSVVVSDMFGVSGRQMLAALIGGENNPQVLAQMARTRMRTKIPQLEEAFVGHFTDHHRFLLTKMLARIDALDVDIADLDTKIEAQIAPFADAVARLDEIPGVGATFIWP
jgi:hypothetical protein